VPTRILAFRDEDAYAPFKSGHDRDDVKILGQFLGHRDGNFITLNADPRFLGGFGVVFHEYVHYFVQHNLPGVPRWFNEGLAEYYSTFVVDGDAAVIGLPVERHLGWIRSHDDLEIASLLESSAETGRSHSTEKAGRFYAVSWGLVHYLFSKTTEHASQLADFFDRTARGEAPSSAFEMAFSIRIADLEERLREYFLGPSLPAARISLRDLEGAMTVEVVKTKPGDLLAILGDLLARQGLEQRAEVLYNLALDHDPDHAEAHAGLAFVRDLQSRFQEADELYLQALELGPEDARTYLLYGRHLLAQMPQVRADLGGESAAEVAEAARNAFSKAVDLAPDFAETHAMFGYTHLFAGDARRGLPHLEVARELLPGRSEVVFHLVQLHLRLAEFDRARALVDGALARIADEEMLYRAREEIERAELIHEANRALRDGRPDEGLRLLDDAISVTSDPQVRAELERQLQILQQRLER
jgi:tetratricopeptide (TPR) repeat protein